MTISPVSRLAIGTVQFGLRYGVVNQGGQVEPSAAADILRYARSVGIGVIDTAIAYGSSESRLGEIGIAGWRAISKLPSLPHACGNVRGWVEQQVDGSLSRLGLDRLTGLLLHHPADLLDSRGDALYAALATLKGEGRVEKIGVSIYGPAELDALAGRYSFDLVQAPFNVVDRRLATSGWLGRLRRSGTEVHTRSAFLQGLMLARAEERPAPFHRWRAIWNAWDEWLVEQSLTPLEGCLGFVLAHPEIDHVVVGVDGLAQLREIVESANTPPAYPPDTVASDEIDLINPARWNGP